MYPGPGPGPKVSSSFSDTIKTDNKVKRSFTFEQKKKQLEEKNAVAEINIADAKQPIFTRIIKYAKGAFILDSLDFSLNAVAKEYRRWYRNLRATPAGIAFYTVMLFLSWTSLAAEFYLYFSTSFGKRNDNTDHVKTQKKHAKFSLILDFIHTLMVTVAIIGAFAAAAVFIAATPILFFTSTVLDTVRNGFLLGAAIYQLNKIKNAEEGEEVSRFHEQKKFWILERKRRAIGFIACLFMSGASFISFVMPHIGLAATAATVVTLGAIHTTLAGLAGVGGLATVAAATVGTVIVERRNKIEMAKSPSYQQDLADKTSISPNQSFQSTEVSVSPTWKISWLKKEAIKLLNRLQTILEKHEHHLDNCIQDILKALPQQLKELRKDVTTDEEVKSVCEKFSEFIFSKIEENSALVDMKNEIKKEIEEFEGIYEKETGDTSKFIVPSMSPSI